MKKNNLLMTAFGLLLAVSMAHAQLGASTGTTTLGVGVNAEAALDHQHDQYINDVDWNEFRQLHRRDQLHLL